MKSTYYITTPLYYVNADPHIGHAYTNVAVDALARFRRMAGDEVYFLTGTDEHGQKIERAAQEQDLDPKSYADRVVPKFHDLWQLLSISNDDFIRTTEPRHTQAVQRVLSQLYEQGDVYPANYQGWYCVPCETFWPEGQLVDKACPDCQRPVEQLTEENYFFRLSKYQEWLVGWIRERPECIMPLSRRNEVLSFLEQPLDDLGISRPKERLNWGIPVPFSPVHVTYVWFDALVNYIAAPAWGKDVGRFERVWPADLHVIGKDILRPHTVYWPIMVHALGLEPANQVFAHGWWKMGEQKVSKSRGNVVNPIDVVQTFGVDGFRYFLLREVPFGQDGVYSDQAVLKRYEKDLANDLGNLLHRTLTMVEKYFDGRVPGAPSLEEVGAPLRLAAEALPDQLDEAMRACDFARALQSIWAYIGMANRFVEEQAPWTLAKEGDVLKLSGVVVALLEALRVVAICVAPFVPTTAQQMWLQLGLAGELERGSLEWVNNWGSLQPGSEIHKGQPLFPKFDDAVVT